MEQMDQETIDDITSRLDDMFSPEEMKHMVDMTQRMAIMIGLLNCGSIDKDVLCAQIYKDKHEMIPLVMIERAYDEKFMLMVGEEINQIDGVWRIHPNVLPHVEQHMLNLDGGVPEGATIN